VFFSKQFEMQKINGLNAKSNHSGSIIHAHEQSINETAKK
jgi:hypothetical protein